MDWTSFGLGVVLGVCFVLAWFRATARRRKARWADATMRGAVGRDRLAWERGEASGVSRSWFRQGNERGRQIK